MGLLLSIGNMALNVVQFQGNLQFNSHSFDSISYQVIIPPQFTLKVEHPRIIAIQKKIPMPWTMYTYKL